MLKKAKITLLLIFFIPFPGRFLLFADDALFLYKDGQKARYEQNYGRAIEKFRASLEKNPHYFLPMIALSECFLKTGEYDEALKYVKLAQKYDKNNVDLYSLEGRIEIGLGSLDKAREAFNRVLAIQPNNLNARFGMAELDIAVGQKRTAAKRYIETLTLSPESQRALLSLSLIYEDLGEEKVSQSYLELALKYHSSNPDVQIAAGRYFLKRGDLKSARMHLETAVSLAARHKEARLLLARVYILTGDFKNAQKQLQGVINLDRNNEPAWYLQGIVYERQGDYKKAFNSFFTILNSFPEDEVVRITLENLALKKTGIKDPVRKRLSLYHYKRGLLFESQNYLDTAKEEYRRSLMLEPESKTARLAYAGIFKAYGYPIKYLNELKVIQKLGHNDPDILDEIEIYSSLDMNSVAKRWDIDQYSIQRNQYTVSIFLIPPDKNGNISVHPFFPGDFLEYFKSYVLEYYNMNVKYAGTANGFESAFNRARKEFTNLFLIVQYNESERDFLTDAGLYLTRTGSKLGYFKEYRTGNDRIRDAVVSITRKLYDFLPVRGKLLKRSFNLGIIDIGRFNNVKKNDELLIIKKGGLTFNTEQMGFLYKKKDIVGKFKVSAVDEMVSEGRVIKNGFFDLINPGDEIIYQRKKTEGKEKKKENNKNLLQRIFKL